MQPSDNNTENRAGPRPPTGKAYKSALRPYQGAIGRWQREGKSYAEIADLLSKQFGLKVHRSTIHSFVQVRRSAGFKKRKRTILPAHFLDERNRVGAIGPASLGAGQTSSTRTDVDSGEPAHSQEPSPFDRDDAMRPRDLYGRPISGNPVKNLPDL